ncbi:hypothetical protein [Pontiella sulfatireligans]|uniref:Uncharacterized protein n=1 Tax=Pontiella sulfatireligans TaxID=2750658 RepID=A0A6C2UIN5_9BACT|nr:hypothetical protein [Pontiella sulfatireligans]VGO20075.1 hypothetical protein SCARR_02135 [Pontiella sulfatireligans]
MTCPRVDFLKKNELRYQGAVSLRFIFVGIVVTPVLFIAILSGVKLIQYSGVQSELKASHEIWADLEPRLKLYQDESHGVAVNQQALDLFDGWTNAQVSFVGLLSGIQDIVPSEIQFTRLSIQSETKTSIHKNASNLGLDYKLLIEGVSQGQQAENEVIAFRKNLLDRQEVADVFDSIILASMRKRSAAAGSVLREFRLEGINQEGGLK